MFKNIAPLRDGGYINFDRENSSEWVELFSRNRIVKFLVFLLINLNKDKMVLTGPHTRTF
jgi:hypothetical protein